MVGKLTCVSYSLVTKLECFKEGREEGYQLFPWSDIPWTSPHTLTLKMSSFIVVIPAYCVEFVAHSKGITKGISWEVKILACAGFKPLPKRTWTHLSVALVPSTMCLFEQEHCCLFGNKVFSRHPSSIKALSLIITVRHWAEWEINHKWQVKHLSARGAFLHAEKEHFSACLHKGEIWI